MKKTVALLLFLVLLIGVLSSCEEEIGDYLSQYDYEEQITQVVTVNLYLPCTADTTENAKISVANRVIALGESDYQVEFQLHYYPTATYEGDVIAAVSANKAAAAQENKDYAAIKSKINLLTEELSKLQADEKNTDAIEDKKAELAAERSKINYESTATPGKDQIQYSVDLVLITSKSMYDSLYEMKTDDTAAAEDQVSVLSDLTSYLAGKSYGRLNTQITSSLLAASKTDDNKFYCVPNNHVVTTGYSYLVIDKSVARDELHYSPAELQGLKSLEDAEKLIYSTYFTEGENPVKNETALQALLGAEYNAETPIEQLKTQITNKIDFANIFKEVTNQRYEDKAAIEATGKYCNIISYPEVTKEEAYLSAFAVANAVSDVSTDRAMQIIYALNTNAEFHNLLLYGIKSSHYNVVKAADAEDAAPRYNTTEKNATNAEIALVTGGDDVYKLASDPIVAAMYCGDQFLSYYCSTWTEEYAANGAKHNAESVVAKSK